MNDPNCIIRAFENTNITILTDNTNGTKHLFRATDVANVIGVTHIYRTIQNFHIPKEKVTQKCLTLGGPQDVVFLTSRGIYRLLHISKHPLAERFRDWVGDILDDILFNQAMQLQKQLDLYRARAQALETENEQLKLDMAKSLPQCSLRLNKWPKKKHSCKALIKKSVIYLGYVVDAIIKFGTTDDLKKRLQDHKRTFGNFRLCWVIECAVNRRLETAIKYDKSLEKYRTKLRIGNTTHCELIQLEDGFGHNELVKTIKMLKDEVETNNNNEIKSIELDTSLQHSMLELLHATITTISHSLITNHKPSLAMLLLLLHSILGRRWNPAHTIQVTFIVHVLPPGDLFHVQWVEACRVLAPVVHHQPPIKLSVCL